MYRNRLRQGRVAERFRQDTLLADFKFSGAGAILEPPQPKKMVISPNITYSAAQDILSPTQFPG